MTNPHDPERDLMLERIIQAPRNIVWRAWTRPEKFKKWWLPEPEVCKIIEMQVRPGGALTTHMSQDGVTFEPHFNGAYLAVDPDHQLIVTNSLVGDWRPAVQPFMTARISLADYAEGTHYSAHVMHRNSEDRQKHSDLGFAEGWGAVTAQLAKLAENETR